MSWSIINLHLLDKSRRLPSSKLFISNIAFRVAVMQHDTVICVYQCSLQACLKTEICWFTHHAVYYSRRVSSMYIGPPQKWYILQCHHLSSVKPVFVRIRHVTSIICRELSWQATSRRLSSCTFALLRLLRLIQSFNPIMVIGQFESTNLQMTCVK